MLAIDEKTPDFSPQVADEPFEPLAERIQAYAVSQPDKMAIHDRDQHVTWKTLIDTVNAIAHRLRAQGLQPGDKVAGLSENSVRYVALYLGVLAAGGCMVPLSGMASDDALELMIGDSDAQFLFVSARNHELTQNFRQRLADIPPERQVGLDFQDAHWQGFDDWLADAPHDRCVIGATPDHPFNIIYSSGTTGTPKGILHDYRFRSRQIRRMTTYGLDNDAINLVSTPLYSNTSLVSVLPTLFNGGTLVLMAKFDARGFLQLAQEYRVTHAMLVPVQYQRILAVEDFDGFDLSSFRLKLSTSAPLRSQVIAEAMRRWPGNILEVYGLTEGGISTSLDCAAHPDKWDSVGKPTEGSQVRVIDEGGRELPQGEIGEIVGRAGAMMRGYYKRDQQTREMLWASPEGEIFLRSGDMGRMDEDGFLYILDRRKDMIISGGFNVYPEDLEKALLAHPAVADVAVIGIPSEQWGETPLGLVVRQTNSEVSRDELLEWANAKLGKTQRLSGIEFRDTLPRSTIGKILKRELRAPYWAR
ncbi:class I adenylate-forming enzyme family protein [Salinicola salarius]|uniref:class I adenylate-forming enzyme family protein n=1 Tax=Salinicola salarius TaxID=430457 RepID=UPI000B3FD646|nr:class I adenylate-forming enzyme family protein [Salinicola salarius]